MAQIFPEIIQYLMSAVFLVSGITSAFKPLRFAEAFQIPTPALFEHAAVEYNVYENLQSLSFIWISFGSILLLSSQTAGVPLAVIIYYLFEIFFRVGYIRNFPPFHIDPTKIPPKSSFIGGFILPIGFIIINFISFFSLDPYSIQWFTFSSGSKAWIILLIVILHTLISIISVFQAETDFVKNVPVASEILSHGVWLHVWSYRYAWTMVIPLFSSIFWLGVGVPTLFGLLCWSLYQTFHIIEELYRTKPWETGIHFSQKEHKVALAYHTITSIILFVGLFI